jgi:hypothetical protein
MATSRGNKRPSGTADDAETSVRTVVAPYLKALRSQALSWSTFPSHSSLILTPVGTHHSVWRPGPPSGAAGSPTTSTLEHAQPSDIVPYSPRIVPFRRSHIFAVCAA